MPEDHTVPSRSRLSASEVAQRSFATVRRGLDPEEVRIFLSVVAEELAAAEQRQELLERELAAAEDQVLHPDIDEATLTAALGQRSAAVLRNSHEEAARVVQEAETSAAGLLREAQHHATDVQVRAEATAAERIAEAEIAANSLQQQARQQAGAILDAAREEAERFVEHAREQGRMMLDQAQEARRRVLADMGERRRAMTAQIDQYRAARDELAAAVLEVRHSVDRIVEDLGHADDAARAAAAQAAHRHPIETTERVLVIEAERAAEELGARTGTPADLEAAANEPLTIDDIRTVVPAGGRPGGEDVDAGDLDDVEVEVVEADERVTIREAVEVVEEVVPEPVRGRGAPRAGSTARGLDSREPVVTRHAVEQDPAPTDPGRPATGPGAPVASFVFDDVRGTGNRAERGAAPSLRVAGPGQRSGGEGSDAGDAGASHENLLDETPPLNGGVFEGESFEGDVFGEHAFGDDTAATVLEDAGPDTGAESGMAAGGAGEELPAATDEDIVEGLFARLRASREAPAPTAPPAPTGGDLAPVAGLPAAGEPAAPAERRERPRAPGVSSRTSAQGSFKGMAPGAEKGGQRSFEGTPDAAAAEEPGEPAAGPAGTPVAERAFVRRTELLGPVSAVLARRLKRALQDDQNRLLERLRSGTGEWADDLLPDDGEHRALYAHAAEPQVREAMAAGVAYARSVGKRTRSKPPAPDGAAVSHLAGDLGAAVVTLLRRRLSGEGIDEPVERVGAAYREWRGERIERLVGDCAVEAFSTGVLAGVVPGTGLRWVRNEASLGCADCEDNALGGVVQVGTEFPTGHRHPPAHAGCRCLVLPTPV